MLKAVKKSINNQKNTMLPLKRRKKILEKLDHSDSVKVEDLASEFEVSPTTVRRDLKNLEKKGLVRRDYGGAVKVERSSTSFEPPYHLKKKEHHEEKRKIGRVASELVQSGETLILDSGSTTLEFAKALDKKMPLTVVTNDLKVSMELVDKETIEFFVLGGKHRKGVYTLQGALAEQAVKNFKVNRTFLGADAIDEKVISNVNTEEVQLKKAMVEAGDKVTVLADHSKFGKRVFTTVCPIDSIDSIITDEPLAESTKRKYEEAGVEIMVTDNSRGENK